MKIREKMNKNGRGAVGTECRRRHLIFCADGCMCPDGGRRDRVSVPTAFFVPTDLSTAGPGTHLCRRPRQMAVGTGSGRRHSWPFP